MSREAGGCSMFLRISAPEPSQWPTGSAKPNQNATKSLIYKVVSRVSLFIVHELLFIIYLRLWFITLRVPTQTRPSITRVQAHIYPQSNSNLANLDGQVLGMSQKHVPCDATLQNYGEQFRRPAVIFTSRESPLFPGSCYPYSIQTSRTAVHSFLNSCVKINFTSILTSKYPNCNSEAAIISRTNQSINQIFEQNLDREVWKIWNSAGAIQYNGTKASTTSIHSYIYLFTPLYHKYI